VNSATDVDRLGHLLWRSSLEDGHSSNARLALTADILSIRQGTRICTKYNRLTRSCKFLPGHFDMGIPQRDACCDQSQASSYKDLQPIVGDSTTKLRFFCGVGMLSPVLGNARTPERTISLHRGLLSVTATSVDAFDTCKCIYSAHRRSLPLPDNIFSRDVHRLVCLAFRPVQVIINGRNLLAHQQIVMR
jgi:hypothetical protein